MNNDKINIEQIDKFEKEEFIKDFLISNLNKDEDNEKIKNEDMRMNGYERLIFSKKNILSIDFSGNVEIKKMRDNLIKGFDGRSIKDMDNVKKKVNEINTWYKNCIKLEASSKEFFKKETLIETDVDFASFLKLEVKPSYKIQIKFSKVSNYIKCLKEASQQIKIGNRILAEIENIIDLSVMNNFLLNAEKFDDIIDIATAITYPLNEVISNRGYKNTESGLTNSQFIAFLACPDKILFNKTITDIEKKLDAGMEITPEYINKFLEKSNSIIELMVAIKEENIDKISELIEKVPFNTRDYAGNSIASLVAKTDNVEIMELLYEYGFRNFDDPNNFRETPLTTSVNYANNKGDKEYETLKFLIKHEADLNPAPEKAKNIFDSKKKTINSVLLKVILEHMAEEKGISKEIITNKVLKKANLYKIENMIDLESFFKLEITGNLEEITNPFLIKNEKAIIELFLKDKVVPKNVFDYNLLRKKTFYKIENVKDLESFVKLEILKEIDNIPQSFIDKNEELFVILNENNLSSSFLEIEK